MNLEYPYQLDGRGRTGESSDVDYINGLIEQVLFTAPGERVNRPSFGSGILQQIFLPNSDAAAAAIQFLVQGALQTWLGSLIALESVNVGAVDSTLSVTVQYTVRETQVREVQTFTSGGQ